MDLGSDPADPASPDPSPRGVAAAADGQGGIRVTFTAGYDPRVGQYWVWRASEPTLVGRVAAEVDGNYTFIDPGYPGGEHEYYVTPGTAAIHDPVFDPSRAQGTGAVSFAPCDVDVRDRDDDDLCDRLEALQGLDPDDPDTDNDGFRDGVEAQQGTDALDARSRPAPTPSSASGLGIDSKWIVLGGGGLLVVVVGIVVLLVMRRNPANTG